MSKIIVAKDGINIPTETDDRNFVFDQSNVYKIGFRGEVTINYTTYFDLGWEGEGSIEFSHNLGYVPVAFVFQSDSNDGSPDGQQLPYNYYFSGGSFDSAWYEITSTKLKVYLRNRDLIGSGSAYKKFRYQIMMDKIA